MTQPVSTASVAKPRSKAKVIASGAGGGAKPAFSTAGGRAYDFIRSSIIDGTFPPGRRLKEEELTQLCGLSRTPVREALRRLASEGLVVTTPNAGAQVISISDEELKEIYELRAMVEGYAAEHAARNITPEAVARLRALAANMERACQGHQDDDFLPSNAEFHRIILDAAQSPRLQGMSAFVIEAPLAVRTLRRYSPEDLVRSMRHHRELIEALEARDGAWAASVMKSHIYAAYHALTR
jgi:DNA-binding GntR family transcriptional regulator